MLKGSLIVGGRTTDGLDRLAACLVATASLVRSLEPGDAVVKAPDSHTTYNLDMSAFEMAVECALLVEMGAPAWNRAMRDKAGMVLAATAGLSRSIDEKVLMLGAFGREPNELVLSLKGLSKAVGAIRERFESLCRSFVMAELCSLALVSRVRMGRDAAGGWRGLTGLCGPVPSSGIRHGL